MIDRHEAIRGAPRERLGNDALVDPYVRSCSVTHALAILRHLSGEEPSPPPSCQQENTTYVNTNSGICQAPSFCGSSRRGAKRADLRRDASNTIPHRR